MGVYLLLVLLACSAALPALGQPPICDKCLCAQEAVNCSDRTSAGYAFLPASWVVPSPGAAYQPANLSLAGCDLVRLQPFPSLTVQFLDLSRNRLQEVDNATFAGLQAMQELDLSQNDLTAASLRPDMFQGQFDPDDNRQVLPLKALRRLRLGANNIHSLPADLFSHTGHLTHLSLDNNPLRTLDLATQSALGSLLDLQFLDLSYCGIQKLPSGLLHTPTGLQELVLTGNEFVEVPVEALSESHGLRILRLSDNKITTIGGDGSFPPLDKLEVLEMSNMAHLESIGKGAMSNLTNLREIYLERNHRLSTINESAFKRLENNISIYPPIKRVSLHFCKLSYLEHETFTQWEEMDHIDLSDNPWSCDCKNNWIITSLMVRIEQVQHESSIHMVCAAPIEMKGKHLLDLYNHNSEMRCLDYYGNHPENDGAILMSFLIGLLIGIPFVLGVILCYKRGFFGILQDRGAAAYTRNFYKRANDFEDI